MKKLKALALAVFLMLPSLAFGQSVCTDTKMVIEQTLKEVPTAYQAETLTGGMAKAYLQFVEHDTEDYDTLYFLKRSDSDIMVALVAGKGCYIGYFLIPASMHESLKKQAEQSNV
jgi:hypothetical protein